VPPNQILILNQCCRTKYWSWTSATDPDLETEPVLQNQILILKGATEPNVDPEPVLPNQILIFNQSSIILRESLHKCFGANRLVSCLLSA
jgi:hypothetical protein